MKIFEYLFLYNMNRKHVDILLPNVVWKKPNENIMLYWHDKFSACVAMLLGYQNIDILRFRLRKLFSSKQGHIKEIYQTNESWWNWNDLIFVN